MRILLVEDNHELAAWLAKALRQGHHVVDIAHDGEDAEHLLGVAAFDVVILDLSLPRLDGMSVLRRLRRRGGKVPVIILTAHASLEGRVAGLDAGADDYLAKPFEIAELEARIRAIVRRGHDQATSLVAVGDLVFDGATRRFSIAEAPVSLTPREHAVLEHLFMNAGKTVGKASLSDHVFGFDDIADANSIEIYVHRVRKKLEGSEVEIATLRGLGYLLRHAG